jgi:hypothetical protein
VEPPRKRVWVVQVRADRVVALQVVTPLGPAAAPVIAQEPAAQVTGVRVVVAPREQLERKLKANTNTMA